MGWFGTRFRIFFSLFCIFTFDAAAATTPREWTVLIYVATDDPEIRQGSIAGIHDIETLPELSSRDDVAFVVQVDDSDEQGDPNYRYRLQSKKPTNDIRIATSPIPENEIRKLAPRFDAFRYGEKDSGNARTLYEFVDWATAAYPAKHYVLMLWGHSWGIGGVMQDFNFTGKPEETGTIIPNYLVAEGLKDLFKKNDGRFPNHKIDTIVFDSCIAGNTDVALEYADVADYLVFSALEVPFYSFRYDVVFRRFFTDLMKRQFSVEDSFLKPLIRDYAQGHVRGGKFAALEAESSPVQMMAIRTKALPQVERALTELAQALTAIPDWYARAEPWVKSLVDGDGYVDLLEFSHAIWRAFPEAARHFEPLRRALGNQVADETSLVTHLSHPQANGAWVYVDIDPVAESTEMAACVGLKSLTELNGPGRGTTAKMPAFFDKERQPIDLREVFCADLVEGEWEAAPILETRRVTRILSVLGLSVEWPEGIAGYVIEEPQGDGSVGSRKLALWFSGERGLNQSVRLRLVGTETIQIEYFDRPFNVTPESLFLHRSPLSHGSPLEEVPLFQTVESFSRSGLYVAESHTNGSMFKQGLSAVFSLPLPGANDHLMGWRPFARNAFVPAPVDFADYLLKLDSLAEPGEHWLTGRDFYNAHRVARTGWGNVIRW